MDREKYLQSTVFFGLDGKIRLFVGLPVSLSPSFRHTLNWFHEFGSDIVLELSDCLGPQILQIEFILNFAVPFLLYDFYNSFHVLSGQFSNVDA